VISNSRFGGWNLDQGTEWNEGSPTTDSQKYFGNPRLVKISCVWMCMAQQFSLLQTNISHHWHSWAHICGMYVFCKMFEKIHPVSSSVWYIQTLPNAEHSRSAHLVRIMRREAARGTVRRLVIENNSRNLRNIFYWKFEQPRSWQSHRANETRMQFAQYTVHVA
jgi:hypothetical protein